MNRIDFPSDLFVMLFIKGHGGVPQVYAARLDICPKCIRQGGGAADGGLRFRSIGRLFPWTDQLPAPGPYTKHVDIARRFTLVGFASGIGNIVVTAIEAKSNWLSFGMRYECWPGHWQHMLRVVDWYLRGSNFTNSKSTEGISGERLNSIAAGRKQPFNEDLV